MRASEMSGMLSPAYFLLSLAPRRRTAKPGHAIYSDDWILVATSLLLQMILPGIYGPER